MDQESVCKYANLVISVIRINLTVIHSVIVSLIVQQVLLLKMIPCVDVFLNAINLLLVELLTGPVLMSKTVQ